MNDYRITYRRVIGVTESDLIAADTQDEALVLFRRRWATDSQPEVLSITLLD